MGPNRLREKTNQGGSWRKELGDRQGKEVEEFLGRTECVGLRKVTITSSDKNWRKFPDKDTVTFTLNAPNQSSMPH